MQTRACLIHDLLLQKKKALSDQTVCCSVASLFFKIFFLVLAQAFLSQTISEHEFLVFLQERATQWAQQQQRHLQTPTLLFRRA
jgi:hypothetical protein